MRGKSCKNFWGGKLKQVTQDYELICSETLGLVLDTDVWQGLECFLWSRKYSCLLRVRLEEGLYWRIEERNLT